MIYLQGNTNIAQNISYRVLVLTYETYGFLVLSALSKVNLYDTVGAPGGPPYIKDGGARRKF